MLYSFLVNILIVGSEGRVGSRLFRDFSKHKFNLMFTSHHLQTKDSIFLDLNEPNFKNIPSGPGTAIICAGITRLQTINDNLAHSYFINVCQTLKLTNSLIQKNWKIVYLSSDAVFQMETYGLDSVSVLYKNYTLQKYIVESTLLSEFTNQIKIVRLSKVLFENLELFRGAESSNKNLLRKNHFVSPTSIAHVVLSLKEILKSDNCLSFICGDRYTSYYDFLYELKQECNLQLPEYKGYYANEDEVFRFVDLDSLKGIKVYPESRSDLMSFITSNSN